MTPFCGRISICDDEMDWIGLENEIMEWIIIDNGIVEGGNANGCTHRRLPMPSLGGTNLMSAMYDGMMTHIHSGGR